MADVADDGAAPSSQIERKEKTAGSRAAIQARLILSIGAGRGRGATATVGAGTVEERRFCCPAFCTHAQTPLVSK